MLRHDESPLWHLAKIAPTTREQELRNFLGGFNFPGTMVTSSIAPFSGGEKARLALALDRMAASLTCCCWMNQPITWIWKPAKH